ncbi:DUF6644 family protein [Methylomonas methanica]|uniref:DUF6644 domain-containing protein n=1 Tax=Methylomonas methanica TaxID=421 RepID=A0A177M3P8_METMH|nr:DUF6644 family protein [Methylomonas methanica]OAH99699.1 hypothetical protein A1332_19495 [Methylomonas methanica]
MSVFELFKALQSSAFGRFIGSLDHLFCAVLELGHIAGMILLLASVLLTSLNLLGLGLRSVPLTEIQRSTRKLFWTGLILLAVSGLLIFIPAATSYYSNDFFWAKFILLGLALLVYFTLYRWVAARDSNKIWLAKATGGLALSLWLGVAFAGRFIGFFA